MTIDFTKLNVETRIDCFDVLDLHEVVGEAAFAGAPSLAVDEGPVEMTEQEYNGLLGAVNGQLAFRVIQAIRRQAEGTNGKEAQP